MLRYSVYFARSTSRLCNMLHWLDLVTSQCNILHWLDLVTCQCIILHWLDLVTSQFNILDWLDLVTALDLNCKNKLKYCSWRGGKPIALRFCLGAGEGSVAVSVHQLPQLDQGGHGGRLCSARIHRNALTILLQPSNNFSWVSQTSYMYTMN